MLHAPVVGYACQNLMFPQALQLMQYPDKDGDYCIGLITSKTICLVLKALLKERPDQMSFYVEESDQNGQSYNRSKNHITHDLLVEAPNPTWGEDLQKHNVAVSKYVKKHSYGKKKE